MPSDEQKQSALLRLLKATTTLPARVTLYASALGAIALIPGADLPPALAALAGGVGVNVLSSILERVARGEAVPDDELRRQVQAAVDQSRIAELLTADEFQAAVGELLRQQKHLEYLWQQSEYDLAGRLLDQYLAYHSLIAPMQEDLTALRDALPALATQQQAEAILARLDQLHALVGGGFPPAPRGGLRGGQREPEQEHVANPFQFGGRINDPRRFIGRQRILREVCGELKKRCNFSLVGEPEIGKSSLLYYLYRTCADWLPGVTVEYVDLQGVLDEAHFCQTVLGKLGERGDTLYDLEHALQGREVILLFDEVERLAGPDFNPCLHDLLRSLVQGPHLALCLASQRPLAQVFPASPGGLSPLHNVFVPRTLGPLSADEARRLLAAYLDGAGVAFAPPEVARLLADSGCHPARLQRLAWALFEEKRP